jgi:hypothetical protein
VSVELANVTFLESGTLTSPTVSEAVVAAALPGCCSMTVGFSDLHTASAIVDGGEACRRVGADKRAG